MASLIDDAHRAYLEDTNTDVAPDLDDLAAIFGIESKVIKSVAKRNHWEVQRLRRIRRTDLARQQIEDKTLESAVVDMVAEQSKILRTNLRILNQDLPKFHVQLMERMETMSDRDFLSAYKLMREVQSETMAIFFKVGKDLVSQDISNSTDEFDLRLGAKITNIIQRASTLGQDTNDPDDGIQLLEDEQTELFEKLDAR